MSTVSIDAGRPALPNAVGAFLRGVERRALVLAELQAGGPDRGDAAVRAAAREFQGRVVDRPLAQWPDVFWSTLLASPLLRGAPASTGGLGWSALAAGPRAALLLRLAAGLDEADAARVLGIGLPAYRLALQSAIEQVGGPDALDALHAELQQRIDALAPERVQAIAAPSAPGSVPVEAARAPRWVLLTLWFLLALCVAAFVATFWWPAKHARPAARMQGGAWIEPLPAPAAPAARYRPEAALLVHQDFALLVDTGAAPVLDGLEFYSWLAAGRGSMDVDATVAGGSVLLPEVDPALRAQLETVDAPL